MKDIYLVIVDYYYNRKRPTSGAVPNLYYACETLSEANEAVRDIANRFINAGGKVSKIYDKYIDFTQVIFEEQHGQRISVYIRPNVPMYGDIKNIVKVGDLQPYLAYTVVLVKYLNNKAGVPKGTIDAVAVCEDYEDALRYACELIGRDYETEITPRGWWDTGRIISMEGELYLNDGWNVEVMIQDCQAVVYDENGEQVLSGIGKVEYSDYDGARVISKDGRHAISFDIYGRGENGITVTSEMKGYGERYGFDWEFLSHIGDYKTLSGAIKAAKRYWNMSGIQYNEKDFEKL